MTSTAAATTGRLPSLDGLRGVAAFTVLLHHCLLVASPYLSGDDAASQWWHTMITTPLALPTLLLTSGTEAVFVFFVLSGFVLTLPAARRPGFDWLAYWPRRLIRLYLPVWGGLLLGTALIYALPRTNPDVAQDGWLVSSNATSAPLGEVLHQATLAPHRFPIDNPLWSLHWELLFSLLLPLYILIVRRIPLTAGLTLSAALAMAGSLSGQGWLLYLPVFMAGASLAAHFERLQRLAAAISARRGGVLIWWGVLGLAVFGMLISRVASALLPHDTALYPLIEALCYGVLIIGSASLLFLCFGWARAASIFARNPVHWLGKISFSLYLVHVPILATAAFAFGSDWPLAVMVAIPVSLLVAWLFYLAVEAPTIALSRATGRAIHARRQTRRAERMPEPGTSGARSSAARRPESRRPEAHTGEIPALHR